MAPDFSLAPKATYRTLGVSRNENAYSLCADKIKARSVNAGLEHAITGDPAFTG